MIHGNSGRPLRRLGMVLLAVTLVTSLSGFRSIESLFAPSADLWPRWQAHDETNPDRIDYVDWADWLDGHVQSTQAGINVIDYGAVTPEDSAALDAVIARLEAVPISGYARSEQLAYWINLYNAVTVRVVIDHYPVETIRDIDISGGLFADGPWDAELVTVENIALSLNDIEHRILRPIWMDPRIHYAVNCASIGCPNLRDEPYQGATVGTVLDLAAREYLRHPRGISVDGDKVTISSIYDWFFEDFSKQDMELLDHLALYAAPELAERLNQIGQIHDTRYDWLLNSPKHLPAEPVATE